MDTTNLRLEKVNKLWAYIDEKTTFHFNKSMRAKKSENIDFHFDLYKIYSDFQGRAMKLSFAIRSQRKFAEQLLYKTTPEDYLKWKKTHKEKGKLKFQSTYRVFLHFFSESLHADYSTFSCDSCNRTFYHSPSTVYLGKDKKYSSCCGYCVNTMMQRNGQEEVYY